MFVLHETMRCGPRQVRHNSGHNTVVGLRKTSNEFGNQHKSADPLWNRRFPLCLLGDADRARTDDLLRDRRTVFALERTMLHAYGQALERLNKHGLGRTAS